MGTLVIMTRPFTKTTTPITIMGITMSLELRQTRIHFEIGKMPLKIDLLNPSLQAQRRCHKKKRLVQSPNSYFMDVKCPGCYKIKVKIEPILDYFFKAIISSTVLFQCTAGFIERAN